MPKIFVDWFWRAVWFLPDYKLEELAEIDYEIHVVEIDPTVEKVYVNKVEKKPDGRPRIIFKPGKRDD